MFKNILHFSQDISVSRPNIKYLNISTNIAIFFKKCKKKWQSYIIKLQIFWGIKSLKLCNEHLGDGKVLHNILTGNNMVTFCHLQEKGHRLTVNIFICAEWEHLMINDKWISHEVIVIHDDGIVKRSVWIRGGGLRSGPPRVKISLWGGVTEAAAAVTSERIPQQNCQHPGNKTWTFNISQPGNIPH